MSATIRAAVSLIALAGFYILAAVLIAGTAFGAFVLGEHFTMMYWVATVAGFTGLFVLAKLVAVAWSRPQLKPGTDVSPGDAPELWALVTGLAQVARTRSPDQIRLVSEANAAVSEDSRLLGLIGGPRRMYLGVPLMLGLSVTQLRAVLAHELGHYSRAHTRLGPIAYRGRQAVTTTVRELQRDDLNWLMRVFGYVLRLPAGLYLLLSLAMSRSQEREADRLMVQVAGRANAQSALREIPIIAAYWNYYLRDFVGLGWGSDLAPTADDFFGGFDRLLAARTAELDTLRVKAGAKEAADPVEKTKEDYARELADTHPPIAERIAVMESIPERTTTAPPDDRRACALVPPATAAATAESAYVFGYRERLDWDELVARACAADDQRTANLVYQTVARVAGEPEATLGTVIALAENDRSATLVRAVAAELNRPYEEIATEVFAVLVRAAVVQARAARWRLSWSGPFELVTADGETFDAGPIAALLADAKTASDAAARLTALGVDVSAAGPDAMTASAHIGEIVGGMSDMRTNGTTYDVLVLDTGLILAEKPPGSGGSLSALTQSGSVAEIAARHRFVPYDSIASAEVSGWFTVKAIVTLNDGTTLRLKEQLSSERMKEDSNEVFKNHLARAGR